VSVARTPEPPAVREERPTSAWRQAVLPALAACLLFALATPWVLRPWFLARDALPRSAGAFSSIFESDVYLNVWILGWTAHAALTHPSRMFDGNIFYPASNTITGSENMLAHLPVTVPALAATGNALVALKAMALESFVLTGLAMFLLVYHHTRNAPAALVAGAAFTFAPWRPNTIPQPQYLGTQYLPLALLAVDCWLERRRPRALVGLAAAMALQGLACVYLGYFAFVVVPAYALARVAFAPGGPRLRALFGVAAGISAGALALVPATIPYLRGRTQQAIPVQDLGTIAVFSWQPEMFLRPGTIAGWIGLVPVVLVVVALILRVGMRRFRGLTSGAPMGATWALGVVAVVLSAGSHLRLPGDVNVPLPYLVLYHLVPGFSTMRAPSRFFIVVVLALCALAGYELARLTSGWRARGRIVLGVGLALACVVLATPRAPAVIAAGLGASTAPAYRWLAQQPPGGGVLEIPGRAAFGDLVGQVREARHTLASTIHWHPIMGGYTAYPPPSAAFFTAVAQRLPDPEAFALLVDTVDVRWIVVHRSQLMPGEGTRWAGLSREGLLLAASFDHDDVYAVTRAPARPWRAEIRSRLRATATTSLEGTSTAPLPSACRQARILEVSPPKSMLAFPVPVPVPVRFQNTSDCTWPSLGLRPDGLVGLSYRWTSPSGRVVDMDLLSRLLHDVRPGEVVESPVLVFPGGEFGTWRLEVFLVQHGQPEPLAAKTVDIEVVRWKRPPP
jgi:hypothetical protein